MQEFPEMRVKIPRKVNPDIATEGELVSLDDLDKPLEKGRRVGFSEDAMQAISLFHAKLELDKQLSDLKALADSETNLEKRKIINQQMDALEKNLSTVIQSLGELRPDDFGDEAAFERALEKPATHLGEVIETAVQKKDGLEEQALASKNSIRLLEDQLKEVPADATELEDELAEARFELFRLHHERLKAWDALAELSPDQYGADAELEHSLFEDMKKKIQAEEEAHTEDIKKKISNL